MVDSVNIENVGGGKKENVASDATLNSLIKAVEKLSAGKSGSAGSKEVKDLANEQKNYKKEVKGSSEELRDFQDEVADTSTVFGDLGSAVGKGIKGLGSLASGIGGLLLGGVTNLGEALFSSSNRLSDFTDGIPVIGQITKALDDNLDSYREMSQVGASFGNSLANMRRAAAESEMSLTDFQSLITGSSEALGLLGGTTSDGAKRLANLSKQLRTGDVGNQLMGMGFTMAEVNESMVGYIELQARQGRLQGMSNRQLIEGSGNYLKELDKLAKITGKSRKELEDKMLADAQEANVMAMIGKLNAEEAANFRANLASMSELGPEMDAAFKDLADGVAQTDLGKKIQSLSPEFAQLAQDAATGRVSQEEFRKRMVASLGPLQSFAKGFDGAGTTALMGVDGLGELFANLYKINQYTEKVIDVGAIEAEQAKRNKITETMGSFEQTIETIRGKIMAALIDSGIFDTFNELFTDFTSAFDDGEFDSVINDLTTGLKDVVGYFSSFINDIKTMDFGDAIEKMFDGLYERFMGDNSSKIKDLDAEIAKVSESMNQKTVTGSQVDKYSSATSAPIAEGNNMVQTPNYDELEAKLAELKAQKEDLIKDGGGTSIFSNLLPDIDAMDVALTAGGVIVGLKALQMALGGFGAPNVIAGAAVLTGLVVGTGAGIMLAGKGVNLVGDGIKSIAVGMEQMSEIQGTDNLKSVAGAMGLLGEGFLSLVQGGVMESIGSFFGADGPFDAVATGVNQFGELDPNAIKNINSVSSSMINLANSTKSLDEVNIKSYTKQLEDLTDTLEKLNEVLSEDNKGAFGGGTGVSVGSMMKEGTMPGGLGSSNTDSMKQLNTTMTAVQSVLMKIEENTNKTKKATKSLSANVYNG